MSKRIIRIPTSAEFLGIVEHPQVQVSVIIAQIVLENLIALALSETMAGQHHLELERVPFPMKLDLAIALGILPLESRPIYLKVNNLRNNFAHDWSATFHDSEGINFYNCLSGFQRRGFGSKENQQGGKAILTQILCVLFVELQQVVTRIRDEKVYSQALHEEVMALRAKSGKPPEAESTKRARNKVLIARKQREAVGEL